MIRNAVLAFLVAGIWLLTGCGGGGPPGTSSTGGTSANLAPGQYLEFLRANGSWLDPLNLVVGDIGTAVLANYDVFGTRTVLPSGNWGTTASGAFVSIVPSTGAFQVHASPGGEFRFQTLADIAGTPTLFEQRGRVPVDTPLVKGRTVELGLFSGLPTSTAVPHLNVDFFNGSGALVGAARTMQDGRFTAKVPLTATHAMVESNSIRTVKFYRSIYFQARNYSPLDTSCRILIGPIGAGTNNLPASMGLPLASGSPPPPPDGCS